MKSEKNRRKDIGEWMVYGSLLGLVVGLFFDSLAIGMIFGLCLGIIVGSIRIK